MLVEIVVALIKRANVIHRSGMRWESLWNHLTSDHFFEFVSESQLKYNYNSFKVQSHPRKMDSEDCKLVFYVLLCLFVFILYILTQILFSSFKTSSLLLLLSYKSSARSKSHHFRSQRHQRDSLADVGDCRIWFYLFSGKEKYLFRTFH